MAYKYETHLHTLEASACSVSTGAEMADAYKKAGYDGIIVTDHFFNGNTAVNLRLSWKEMVRSFCRGYENAKKRGEQIGLSVFFAWEFAQSGSEFITCGLDGDWLSSHPEIMEMPLHEYLYFTRRHGGYNIHAHPFRQRMYIRKINLFPDYTGAVETFNAGNDDRIFDSRADWYANSYSFPKTAGSDAHNAEALDGSGVISNYKLNSIHDYILAVENRELELITKI